MTKSEHFTVYMNGIEDRLRYDMEYGRYGPSISPYFADSGNFLERAMSSIGSFNRGGWDGMLRHPDGPLYLENTDVRNVVLYILNVSYTSILRWKQQQM